MILKSESVPQMDGILTSEPERLSFSAAEVRSTKTIPSIESTVTLYILYLCAFAEL